MRDLIGRTLGHYRIVEKIGAGGRGEVYRAHDERLDRDVAIKGLHEPVVRDADRLARFEREAGSRTKMENFCASCEGHYLYVRALPMGGNGGGLGPSVKFRRLP